MLEQVRVCCDTCRCQNYMAYMKPCCDCIDWKRVIVCCPGLNYKEWRPKLLPRKKGE